MDQKVLGTSDAFGHVQIGDKSHPLNQERQRRSLLKKQHDIRSDLLQEGGSSSNPEVQVTDPVNGEENSEDTREGGRRHHLRRDQDSRREEAGPRQQPGDLGQRLQEREGGPGQQEQEEVSQQGHEEQQARYQFRAKRQRIHAYHEYKSIK